MKDINLDDLTLVMERGDGVKELVWPRSTYKYLERIKFYDETYNIEYLNVLVGLSGPMEGKTIGIDQDGEDLLRLLSVRPMTSGHLYLFDDSITSVTYIGKSGLIIEEYYNDFGIKPEFYQLPDKPIETKS